MMSITTIQRMATEQGDLAREQGREPLRFQFNDIGMFPPFPFPYLGDYIPEGYISLLDDEGDPVTLFCDSTGWSNGNEPALSIPQLKERLYRLLLSHGQVTPEHHHAHLYGAIVESGECQLIVALYTKDGE